MDKLEKLKLDVENEIEMSKREHKELMQRRKEALVKEMKDDLRPKIEYTIKKCFKWDLNNADTRWTLHNYIGEEMEGIMTSKDFMDELNRVKSDYNSCEITLDLCSTTMWDNHVNIHVKIRDSCCDTTLIYIKKIFSRGNVPHIKTE